MWNYYVQLKKEIDELREKKYSVEEIVEELRIHPAEITYADRFQITREIEAKLNIPHGGLSYVQ